MSVWTTTITLGYTTSDRAANYIPMMDGYRTGADQEQVSFEVPTLPGDAAYDADNSLFAEAAWVLTNAPEEVIATYLASDTTLARLIQDMHAALDNADLVLPRSLSIGDTVTVAGNSDTLTFACERMGWSQVQA